MIGLVKKGNKAKNKNTGKINLLNFIFECTVRVFDGLPAHCSNRSTIKVTYFEIFIVPQTLFMMRLL